MRKLFLILLFISFTIQVSAQVMVKRHMVLMGSTFEIILVDKDTTLANQHIDLCVEEISRIENLISEWRPQTQISRVNQNAGIKPVKVDKEVFDLTKRAINYSRLSYGAFDISIAALDKIWIFDGSMDELPSKESIEQSIKNIGYQYILLDSVNSTIYLEKPGMKIGFGSIGKGYAADKGRELMQKLGIEAGLVNASGDISTWGNQINGEPWKIGINNPYKMHKVLKVIQLENGAVTTSGSYEKYAEINSKRYSHIINPKTGWPSTGLTSVTVYGFSAEIANSLSTSIMVLGKKKGKKLLKLYPEYKAIYIKDKKYSMVFSRKLY